VEPIEHRRIDVRYSTKRENCIVIRSFIAETNGRSSQGRDSIPFLDQSDQIIRGGENGPKFLVLASLSSRGPMIRSSSLHPRPREKRVMVDTYRILSSLLGDCKGSTALSPGPRGTAGGDFLVRP